MSKINVGILFGGQSAEHEISLVSAKNVIDAIDKEKYSVELIGIDKNGKWHISIDSNFLLNSNDAKLIKLNKQSLDELSLVPGNQETKVIKSNNSIAHLDVVFPILHGPLGEDGSVQGLLRLLNIPFVGSGVLGSAVCMDKEIMKKLFLADQIPSCRYKIILSHEDINAKKDEIINDLGLPVYVKPANMGSSVGISKVKTEDELINAIHKAFQYDVKVIIEEEIKGREIEVAILGNEELKASIPGEILPTKDFYSFEAKYVDEKGADLIIPAKLNDQEIKTVQELAIKAFKSLSCEGMARVDFFYTEDKKWLINEINSIPGFTKISMYPSLWKESGYSYSELIDELLQLAILRHQKLSKLSSANID